MIDRIKRLEELFLHEINTHVTRLIASGHFTGFITITAVKIAKDLATAKVYYSVFGSDTDKKLAERNFEELRTKIGGLLRPRLHLKRIPSFHFILDNTPEKAARVEEIFNKIEKEEHHE